MRVSFPAHEYWSIHSQHEFVQNSHVNIACEFEFVTNTKDNSTVHACDIPTDAHPKNIITVKAN